MYSVYNENYSCSEVQAAVSMLQGSPPVLLSCDQSLCPLASITQLLPSYESHPSAPCICISGCSASPDKQDCVVFVFPCQPGSQSSKASSFTHPHCHLQQDPLLWGCCVVFHCAYMACFPHPSAGKPAAFLGISWCYDMLTLSSASLKSGLSGPYRLYWEN